MSLSPIIQNSDYSKYPNKKPNLRIKPNINVTFKLRITTGGSTLQYIVLPNGFVD